MGRSWTVPGEILSRLMSPSPAAGSPTIGKSLPKGTEEIDARGRLVTPGLRRCAHPLRRAGHLEFTSVPLLLERRHHRAAGQLRRRLRALPCRSARHAGQTDGGRRGHPGGCADRGPALDLAHVSRFSRCARRSAIRHGHRGASPARGAAGLRHGPARRGPRAGHRAGSPTHGRPGRGRHPRRSAWLFHLAHAQSSDTGRQATSPRCARRKRN